MPPAPVTLAALSRLQAAVTSVDRARLELAIAQEQLDEAISTLQEVVEEPESAPTARADPPEDAEPWEPVDNIASASQPLRYYVITRAPKSNPELYGIYYCTWDELCVKFGGRNCGFAKARDTCEAARALWFEKFGTFNAPFKD